MKPFIIIKNTDRYPGIDPKMPESIICYGTIDQATELAFRLSNWNAGCDYSWYVEGVED